MLKPALNQKGLRHCISSLIAWSTKSSVETCPESEGIATSHIEPPFFLFFCDYVETCPESEGIATPLMTKLIQVLVQPKRVETCPESEGIAT